MNKSQKNRVQKIFSGSHDIESFRRLIKKERDPVALHQIAELCNSTGYWHDAGFEWPQVVAEHPCCDAGTALMLYWIESPEFVYEQGSCEDSSDDEVAHLEYLKAIEAGYLEGIYKSARIKFDPRKSLAKKSDRVTYRWIPCGMFGASTGRSVPPLKWSRDDEYNVILK